ncbi:hypothetical protein T02_14464 [Trichinella nativa]|uniref:Uncharacterized protein n=1 Tax=Trichinella nativa TaxID=6335 RepID=A0A0V1L231_9BILA|nr:hypothetical protein T02_13691 [Trichinella nativa]KRZ63223.1 hypothetical protein T02_14464 [Trichinella nativa]
MLLKHIARKWFPNVIIADNSNLQIAKVQMLLESETFPGRFWKVPRQTNGYVLNKCPLNSPCAYLNTQGSSPCGTPLILIDDS